MKKEKMSLRDIVRGQTLSREEMKQVKGGLTACGQGYTCGANQCCSVPVNGSAIGVCEPCVIQTLP